MTSLRVVARPRVSGERAEESVEAAVQIRLEITRQLRHGRIAVNSDKRIPVAL
jgi:hypothetical protein